MIRTVRRFAVISAMLCSLIGGLSSVEAKPVRGAAPTSDSLSVKIVSFGLSDEHTVFKSEAEGAARAVAAYFAVPAKSATVRFNTRRVAQADAASLRTAIVNSNTSGNGTPDLLTVVLTSHGTDDGLIVSNRHGKDILSPRELKRILSESQAQYRIVIVSACFSGIFANALADRNTLVMTAASSDRTSFGCSNKVKWTFFGDAFFNTALKRGTALPEVFAEAQRLIAIREKKEGYLGSNPQISGGEEVLRALAHR